MCQYSLCMEWFEILYLYHSPYLACLALDAGLEHTYIPVLERNKVHILIRGANEELATHHSIA